MNRNICTLSGALCTVLCQLPERCGECHLHLCSRGFPGIICYLIWGKPGLWRDIVTKRTGSDQMPGFLCNVWSEPELFVTYAHLQKNTSLAFCTI